ncbi:MAG: hypothetical protein AAGD96_00955 [Chloroflexota bacterium]
MRDILSPHNRTGWFALLFALFLVISGCTTTPDAVPSAEPAVNETSAVDIVPVSTSTATPIPTETDSPPPTEIPTLATTPIPAETDTPLPPPTDTSTPLPVEDELFIEAGQLNLYPAGPIYVGDQVTFQLGVSIPDDVLPDWVVIDVLINGEEFTRQTINASNLGRERVLLLPRSWDTTNYQGVNTITFWADPTDQIQDGDENPDNNIINFEVTVLGENPLSEFSENQEWIVRETEFARVHVVSGTAAHRDIQQLLVLTDESIQKASIALREVPRRTYDVYFIEKVIGQGGYAGGSMVVSYSDRNYSGGRIEEVLVHETIHLLDQQISTSGRLTFLAEGLAVWGSGGHYKPEDLNGRAAALVATGFYIPLPQIIDNFYPVQHEIGYLEAGAFVQYLVETYGWDKFRELYSTFKNAPDGQNAVQLDQYLLSIYGKTLVQIEQEWLTKLGEMTLDKNIVADLNGTIRFYNIMRRYQANHDPTAYFLEAWLPRPNLLRDTGTTAELSRRPELPINLVLEVMLTEAEILLRSGNFRQAEVLMGSIERALDNQNNFIDPLGASYNEITLQAYDRGYEVQRILLDGQNATAVYTINNESQLYTLKFTRERENWVVAQ